MICNDIHHSTQRSFPGMTTKFEHLIINSLTRHNIFVVRNTLINIHQIPETNLLRVKKPPSMDRILRSQKIESMRKMMLMQEQLFKQQVEELHRLYNLQKKLMQEIENGLKPQHKEKTATTNSEFAIRNQIPTESKQSFQEMNARKDDQTNEVVSGSNSAENARRPINFDLEMGGESTPSSSMHPYLYPYEEKKKVDDDVEVELTLSLGHCTRKQRSEMEESDDRSRRNEVLEAASSSSSVYQDNNRPHWLMQDLSLNNTT